MRGDFQLAPRALLVGLGVLCLAAGLFWPFFSRYLGRLPGDLMLRRGGVTVVFPIVTCLLLSLILTLLFWLLRR
jgi:hypothetical protein